MKVSKESKKGARLIFDAARSSGRLDEDKVRRGIAAVMEKKPAGSAQILHELHRLVRLEVEKHEACVETAASLNPQERAALETSLSGKFGGGLTFRFSVNPELIGGVRIRIGSDVYDANVRDRLVRLKAELTR